MECGVWKSPGSAGPGGRKNKGKKEKRQKNLWPAGGDAEQSDHTPSGPVGPFPFPFLERSF